MIVVIVAVVGCLLLFGFIQAAVPIIEQRALDKYQKLCPHCQSQISLAATRCPHCTAEVPLDLPSVAQVRLASKPTPTPKICNRCGYEQGKSPKFCAACSDLFSLPFRNLDKNADRPPQAEAEDWKNQRVEIDQAPVDRAMGRVKTNDN